MEGTHLSADIQAIFTNLESQKHSKASALLIVKVGFLNLFFLPISAEQA